MKFTDRVLGERQREGETGTERVSEGQEKKEQESQNFDVNIRKCKNERRQHPIAPNGQYCYSEK